MNAETLIEIADLKFAYGTNQVLKGINLKVPRGKVVAILGTSGCGKSTLLRLIGGQLRPRGGHVPVRRPRPFGGDLGVAPEALALLLLPGRHRTERAIPLWGHAAARRRVVGLPGGGAVELSAARDSGQQARVVIRLAAGPPEIPRGALSGRAGSRRRSGRLMRSSR